MFYFLFSPSYFILKFLTSTKKGEFETTEMYNKRMANISNQKQDIKGCNQDQTSDYVVQLHWLLPHASAPAADPAPGPADALIDSSGKRALGRIN